MSVMTPAQIVADFLAQRPDTIRSNLYFQLSYATSDGEFVVDGDFEGQVRDQLKQADEHGATRGTLKVVQLMALVDYALAAPADRAERVFKSMSEDRELSPNLQRLALEAPLRRKHFERAGREWNLLRQSSLSYDALQRFQFQQIAERGLFA